MAVTLEELGLSQEEIAERVVERICAQLLESYALDEDGELVWNGKSELGKKLKGLIEKRIDETINALAEKHVLPNVANLVETICFQETNRWGEKQGKPVSFIEYLANRAEHYLQEKVNFDGKSKSESGSYSWSGDQTRITHLIHQHLHYSIKHAMESALSGANGQIAKAIEETARIKLAELSEKLKVAVSVK